jgi:NAD+ kinase
MSTHRSQPPSAANEVPVVERVSVIVHGRPARIGDALERLRGVAGRHGIELRDRIADADLVVVLGGDGTMLRALHETFGRDIPCLGVNFGRVGFLTGIHSDELEPGLERAFSPGGLEVAALPTIEGDSGRAALVGVNDIVLTSGIMGRMALIEWCVDGQSLGEVGCDGVIVATPTGSTAYNLSAGGPVLAWGLDGFVVSFVSPHSLHVRSMVLGRAHQVELHNRSDDVEVQAVVDGHIHSAIEPGGRLVVRMSEQRALVARLAGTSFFTRYRQTFGT